MKKKLQGLIAGVLIGTIVTGITVIATNTTTLYDVIANGVKIVVDGQKLNPTDAQGNKVEPIIYNGTTYLPVRAVANALGKAVYWDGPNYTVYLGDMNGKLEYPTVKLEDMTNIGTSMRTSSSLTDNYGNNYGTAFWGYSNSSYQYLLDMKYSKFKCILYVPEGMPKDYKNYINIEADGKTVYTSPAITKTSRPIQVELNIRGCNNFEINFSDDWLFVHVANAGFYQ